MPRLALAALVAALAVAPLGGCIIETDDGDSSITVVNVSSYLIEELRVAPVGSRSWGPDLLGGDILRPNEEITIIVECDTWDVLIVDDTGLECVLTIDLCFEDAEWVIDNTELAICEFGVKKDPTSAQGEQSEAAKSDAAQSEAIQSEAEAI